MTQGSVAKRLY